MGQRLLGCPRACLVYRLLWTEEGTEDGTYGHRTALFFSLGKEICKVRLWK
jgi:hypothetical protein